MKIRFNNKRSSPIRIDTTIGDRSRSINIDSNREYTFEDILVRLQINDDVVEKEIKFRFFDRESGDQLIVDESGNQGLDIPYKLVGENMYLVEKKVDFTDKSRFLCKNPTMYLEYNIFLMFIMI